MGIQWAKRGKEAAAAIEKDEAERQQKYEANRRMFRFFMGEDEDAQITFVDGDLTEDKVLDMMTYREHRIFMNGSWNNFFVCTQDVEPCPICETGDNPSIVGVLTVIDHRTYKAKQSGKVFKDTRKLFVAKRDTLKLLQKIATKRGGLAGARFDVSRTGEKSAAVGTSFDFVDKTPIAELRKKYTEKTAEGKTVTYFLPADYEAELAYKSAAELRTLGFGSTPLGTADTKSQKDYSDEL